MEISSSGTLALTVLLLRHLEGIDEFHLIGGWFLAAEKKGWYWVVFPKDTLKSLFKSLIMSFCLHSSNQFLMNQKYRLFMMVLFVAYLSKFFSEITAHYDLTMLTPLPVLRYFILSKPKFFTHMCSALSPALPIHHLTPSHLQILITAPALLIPVFSTILLCFSIFKKLS